LLKIPAKRASVPFYGSERGDKPLRKTIIIYIIFPKVLISLVLNNFSEVANSGYVRLFLSAINNFHILVILPARLSQPTAGGHATAG